MDWSPKQDLALKKGREWFNSRSKKPFILNGVAGTGKTTLARHFAEGVGKEVAFCAFTGKAASVMRQSGCQNATTIHQLIYTSAERSRRKIRELNEKIAEASGREKKELEKELRREEELASQPMFHRKPTEALSHLGLVIVDECSQVDNKIGDDLMSFGVPVLVLGDPAQLPPIKGGGYFQRQEADIFLDEIHRQAKGNPIIELATDVREGRRLRPGQYGDSCVTTASPTPEEFISHDMVLVGRNSTRSACNRWFRQSQRRPSIYPVAGDKLVCLKNNHERGILNGEIWRAASNAQLVEGEKRDSTFPIVVDIDDEEGREHEEVPMLPQYFVGREETISPWEKRVEVECFDWGYCLTVHKAQGSQWASVLINDEGRCFGRHYRRWLYTAITRAAERVTVKLND